MLASVKTALETVSGDIDNDVITQLQVLHDGLEAEVTPNDVQELTAVVELLKSRDLDNTQTLIEKMESIIGTLVSNLCLTYIASAYKCLDNKHVIWTRLIDKN